MDGLAEKSKKAYVRLYEKVGEEIGMHFLDKLEGGGLAPAIGNKRQSEFERVMADARGGSKSISSTAQDELKRIAEERRKLTSLNQERERQFMRSEINVDGRESLTKKTSISDLFKKYNI